MNKFIGGDEKDPDLKNDSLLPNKRLIIVSNRLPLTIEKKKGSITFKKSVGGLATGLASLSKEYSCFWIGWPGISNERISREEIEQIKPELQESNLYPVFLSRSEVKNFYHGFSNKTIWPLFHYFPLNAVFDKQFWIAYKEVNEKFSEVITSFAKPGDYIWIHDYHLFLLPMLLRQSLPEANIGFFLHIPFPSFELFRNIPWRKELLAGLLGADVVGFHTYDYAYHFLSCVQRLLETEHSLTQIQRGNRLIHVDVFPMGIDYDRFAGTSQDQQIREEMANLRRKTDNQKIILSIDRLDYTKGLLQRLNAYDLFLETYPQFKEKVSFIMVQVPSRTSVETYQELKQKIDELIGCINGKHGTIGWTPISNLFRSLPFQTLAALYNIADIALVTPLRDGMNLVAKEFIACKHNSHGVLIISEMAGAARELGEAIIVNPNNIEETTQAIYDALSMPEDEQRRRNKAMQQRLRQHNINRWAEDFMARLFQAPQMRESLKPKKLLDREKNQITEAFAKSKSRTIFLDYDGTLIPFAGEPQKAFPDVMLIDLLQRLAACPENRITIISGRDKKTLGSWFGHINVLLIAEHGVWIKERDQSWEPIESCLQNEWKDELRPLFELYLDRTPGSLLEEKDYSIAWHYRACDPELASTRVAELKYAIIHMIANRNLSVMEGNKVIEVKHAGINKGTAALRVMARQNCDFVLALGDDVTDEDLFASMPPKAYTIKVGSGPTRARYCIESVRDVRLLLEKFSQVE